MENGYGEKISVPYHEEQVESADISWILKS